MKECKAWLIHVIVAAAFMVQPALGQEHLTENTRSLPAGAKSPPATIAEMAWLAGHWTGPAFGGTSEEIWSPPRAGVMMGMYRLVRDGKTVLYELLWISEEEGSLILRFKHFNADLTGWEEKDQTVDFRYIGKADGRIMFEGMTFEPKGETEVTIYLAFGNKGEAPQEEIFRYKRVGHVTTQSSVEN